MGTKEQEGKFAQELFYNIVDCYSDENPLDSTTVDAFYRYFNNLRGISAVSRKIKQYTDPIKFSAYLTDVCSDAMAQDICTNLEEYGISINPYNYADEIADLFNAIIMEAIKPHKDTTPHDIILYLDKLKSRYCKIKTVMYKDGPVAFEQNYVPNDIFGTRMKRHSADKILLNGSGRYFVITGTGGIGKSMLMTHLVLQLSNNYNTYHKIPILLQLCSYNSSQASFMDMVRSQINISNLEEHLANGDCVLLLDEMDEIKIREIQNFESELSDFVEKYSKNKYIMSSRPINKFQALTRFEVCKLAPFTKAQAMELVEKLAFCLDQPEIKANFLRELDETLFETHRDFAEIPLLLVLMLMTYERYAKIPAKRHVFYYKVFDTLVEQHDAAKIGFNRVFKTQMNPEEFSMVLEEFCARTYIDEKFEFTQLEFEEYFHNLRSVQRIGKNFSCTDLISDLTVALCILTHNNDKYRFIHRSFQEYFCAVKFAKCDDAAFKSVAAIFDKRIAKITADYTFDMMFDMAPSKTERFIYIPYLTELLDDCHRDADDEQAYWNFLLKMYPMLYYCNGEVKDYYENVPSSYIYQALLNRYGMDNCDISTFLPFDKDYVFETYLTVTYKNGGTKHILSSEYNESESRIIDGVEETGFNLEIDTAKLRKERSKLHDAFSQPNFPLYCEFIWIHRILEKMKNTADFRKLEKYEEIFV